MTNTDVSKLGRIVLNCRLARDRVRKMLADETRPHDSRRAGDNALVSVWNGRGEGTLDKDLGIEEYGLAFRDIQDTYSIRADSRAHDLQAANLIPCVTGFNGLKVSKAEIKRYTGCTWPDDNDPANPKTRTS